MAVGGCCWVVVDGADRFVFYGAYRTSEYYDPNQDMWTTGPPLPDSVSFAAYSVLQVSTFQEDDLISMETN